MISGILIQKRDLEILKALFACGFLSTTQIQQLFFGENRSVVCRRLNKCLLPNKIVTRYRPGMAFDSTEAVYCLGSEGVSILAAELNVDTSEIAKPSGQKYNPLSLQHTLEINDFWIAIRAACHQSGDEYKLLSWWTEKKLRKRYQRLGNIERPLPDSRFVLYRKRDAAEKLFFLEVDRGTERQAIFKQKIERYLAYYISGQQESDFGYKIFRVLTVVPDESRLQTLLKVSAEAGANNIFLFGLKENVCPEEIFKPFWVTPRDFYDAFKDTTGTISVKEKKNGTGQRHYSIF